MLPNVNAAPSIDPKMLTKLSPITSYNEFEQDDDNHVAAFTSQQYSITNSTSIQRRDQQSFPTSRQVDSPLAILTFCPIKDSIAKFFTEKDEPKSTDDEQARSISSSSSLILTSNRAQQTSPTDMFPIVNNTTIDNKQFLQRQAVLQRNHSENSVTKQNSSDEQSTIINGADDEEETPHAIKSSQTTSRSKQTPKIKYSNNHPSSADENGKRSTNNWHSASNTPRTYPVVPSIARRPLQGILVQFVRAGQSHHRGLRVAVNEIDLKSWEAFLNYLNRQPNLALSTGGIRHIYSLTGEEILSINQFQHRQSYVVSSGAFIRTNYRYINDSFADESDNNLNPSAQPVASPYWNTRSSVHSRWRSPGPPSSSLSITNGEQIFLLPYSKLNLYESLILNRNLTQTFEEWLQDQVTDVLSQHTNNEIITNLFAVLNSTFIEVKSFSKLFSTIKKTDTFIGCTEDEYARAKDYLDMVKPNELFVDRKWSKQSNNENNKQRFPSKRVIDETKPIISWIHGYNGENELTKKLYTLPEHEILYVIDSICVLYDTNLKQQRFYTKHKHLITCVNVHRSQSLVASSEKGSIKVNQRALIHIWDHTKLEIVRTIQKDQFGSFISLLSFSPKADDDLLLVISRDKPKIILFIDWKRNELIYSITCKSDNILSVLFVFGTTEWIACISQRHLLFYHVNWSTRPLRMLERRESEVQNIYTGAAACDISGERLLVGDEVGNIYIWGLIDKEPKLIVVQECVLENDVELIVPINHETFLLANRENQVKVWNIKKDSVEQIRLNENIGTIQSACCIQRGSVTVALAIGTKSNYIISKDMDNDQFHALMRGHTSPVICLCCSRDAHHFFSISSDRYLFKWNIATKSVEWSTKSTQPISCADSHPERNILVLGTETSKLILYDTISSFYIATITLKFNTGVKSVRFSPDGLNLAVGLQNGNVYIYDVVGNGDFHQRSDGMLQNDTAAVNTVIWSIDGKYLLVVYSDNDYNIWTIPAFEINRGKKIENIEWDRIIHPLMCHILDKSVIDTQTSAVILSSNLVLCCGKDGQLRLFRNRFEHNSQSFQFGLGSVHSIMPSPTNNSYLLTFTNNPTIIEIQIDIQTHV